MSEITNTEVGAASTLTQKPFVEEIRGVPHIFHPTGDGQWDVNEHAELLAAPIRKRGTLTIHEVDSFIDVTKRYGSLANCNIYLDVDYGKQRINAKAVFNDHADGDGVAGWRDHCAAFTPKFSEEWTRWLKQNKEPLDQVKFAHFLEENVGDIVSPEGSKMPTGADIMTFVTTLEETRKVKYGSGVTLQNGMVQIEFIEESDGATKGKLELFREFAIGIRPFFGGDAYQLKAFLRYRIDRNSGAIVFWYELQRPDRVLEDASKALIQKIHEKTGLPIIYGTP